jgi:molybdenum cofactor guanylyltransferase
MHALILAGGENTRMPVLKAFIKVDGKRVIERNSALLSTALKSTVISTNSPESFFYLGCRMVGDILPYRGPMTGIFSAFAATGVPEFFVTACDMPFINVILVQYLAGKWKDRCDALVPVFGGEPQPLFAVYSRRVAAKMELSLRSGSRRMRTFLSEIDVLYLEEKEVRSIDRMGLSFVNINTPEDLEKEGGRICLG